MYALMREYPIYTCTVCGCRQRSDNKVQCEDEFLDIGEMVEGRSSISNTYAAICHAYALVKFR